MWAGGQRQGTPAAPQGMGQQGVTNCKEAPQGFALPAHNRLSMAQQQAGTVLPGSGGQPWLGEKGGRIDSKKVEQMKDCHTTVCGCSLCSVPANAMDKACMSG